MSSLPFDVVPLPIRTDRTLRAVPYVTYTLCFLCILVYLAGLQSSEYDLYVQTQRWGFIAAKPSLVTLFTSAFLHGDLLHLTGNLLILWLVGTVLEAGIGSVLFALLYLASLVTSIILFGLIGKIFMPTGLEIPLIGASGAISGVTGFAAFRYFRLRVQTIWIISLRSLPLPIPYPLWVPMWVYAAVFAGREVFDGISEIVTHTDGNVAHWAHIGGLLLGGLVAQALQSAKEGHRESVLEDSVKATQAASPAGKSRNEVFSLLQQHPDDPELLEAMGGLMLADGRTERSREYYLRAIPRFITTGRPDRAAISYLNILQVFPDAVLTPRDQIGLASMLESLGHYREAARAFMLAAEQYPDREEAETALLRAAQVYQRNLGDAETARTLLHNLLATYPGTQWKTLAQERLHTLGR